MIFAIAMMAALAAPTEREAGEDSPMRFSRHGPVASADLGVINAKGAITADTPAEFERFIKAEPYPDSISYITLDSSGGNLFAAMKLGRAIRRWNLRTAIFESEEDEAQCLSACAYAFLGGVQRKFGIWEGDPEGPFENEERLGFHRYSGGEAAIGDTSPAAIRALTKLSSAEAQAAASELAEYVQEMGVGLQLLGLAADAAPETMRFPPRADLVRLGVLLDETFGPFKLVPDGSGVSAVSLSRSGEDAVQIALHCAAADSAASTVRFVISRPKNGNPMRPPPPTPVEISSFDRTGGRRATDFAEPLDLPADYSHEQWVQAATAGPPQEIVSGVKFDLDSRQVTAPGAEIRIFGDRSWTHIVMWLKGPTALQLVGAQKVAISFDAPTYTGLFGYYPILQLSDSDRRTLKAAARPCLKS